MRSGYYGPLIMGCVNAQKPGTYVEMSGRYVGRFALVIRAATLDDFLACRRERKCGPLSPYTRRAIAQGAHFYEVHTD
jgi:hypothetical protein